MYAIALKLYTLVQCHDLFITSSISLSLILLIVRTEGVNYSITIYDIAFNFKLPGVDSIKQIKGSLKLKAISTIIKT